MLPSPLHLRIIGLVIKVGTSVLLPVEPVPPVVDLFLKEGLVLRLPSHPLGIDKSRHVDIGKPQLGT